METMQLLGSACNQKERISMNDQLSRNQGQHGTQPTMASMPSNSRGSARTWSKKSSMANTQKLLPHL